MGTVFVFLPLSWDALNFKISMNDYAANLLELTHILYQFVCTVSWQQRWALCFQFSELPIFYKSQMRCQRINHVVRNLNELLNPNHPPIRPWICLSAPRARSVEYAKPLFVHILRDRHLPYETVDGKHLSSTGYLLWLSTIINGAVLAVVDQSKFLVKEDFERINVFNVDVDHSAYFPTTADTQKAIESDLLDSDLIVRLRELRHPGIDCRALESSYPDPEPEIIEVPASTPQNTRAPPESRVHRSTYHQRYRGPYNRNPYNYNN